MPMDNFTHKATSAAPGRSWHHLLRSIAFVGLFFAASAQGARAGEGDIGPVTIETIAIIATPTSGHIAGNMEVKILGGFATPPGTICVGPFVTTRRIFDPDRAMLSLLRDAKNNARRVRLRISDSPALRAFPGRCSIVLVEYPL